MLRCSLRPSDTSLHNHQHQVLQGYTYVGCGHLPVVIGLRLLWLCCWEGLAPGWMAGLAVTAPYALMCMVSPKLRWLRGLTVIAAGMLVCKNGPSEQEPPGRVTSVGWGCLLGIWWDGSCFRSSSLNEQV